MNYKRAPSIAIFLCLFLAVVFIFLKLRIYPTIGWDTILLAIGVVVSIVLGGFNMFNSSKSLNTDEEAIRISKLAITPNIEFKYELRDIKNDKKEKKSYYNYIQKNLDKYGRKYHHLILFNGGNGQAINWVDAYNWESFDGEPDGFDYEYLPQEQFLIHTNYLFPGKENIQIPAIVAQNDVYEDAKWLLIRIKYSDMLGNKHCKCKQFIREKSTRSFIQDSQKAKYNIFCVRLPESKDNLKRCQNCFFDKKLTGKEEVK